MSDGELRLDAPFYTEEELDALYESNPVEAMRISREQHFLRRQIEAAAGGDPSAPMPSDEDVKNLLEDARAILLRDGGDLEFVALEGNTLRVRLKGACAGCPRAPLDLRNVVEALVRRRYPQIREVVSIW